MSDDAIGYASRVQAEIEAEANLRRSSDPTLALLEEDITRAWAQAAPGATAQGEGRLLDRLDQLALISVDPPTGNRLGAREVKKLVRKFTRWYMGYVVDQLNAFYHLQGRLLRSMETRLATVERNSVRHMAISELVDRVREADQTLCTAVTQRLSSVEGHVVVVSCGTGTIVAALGQAGISAHGVDETPAIVMPGVMEGLDLRVGTPLEHLSALGDATLGAVVLTGVIERRGIVDLLALVDESLRCLSPAGTIVVAAADPRTRTGPEADLLRGYGLVPETWAFLLSKRGCVTKTVDLVGSSVSTLVVAQSP